MQVVAIGVGTFWKVLGPGPTSLVPGFRFGANSQPNPCFSLKCTNTTGVSVNVTWFRNPLWLRPGFWILFLHPFTLLICKCLWFMYIPTTGILKDLMRFQLFSDRSCTYRNINWQACRLGYLPLNFIGIGSSDFSQIFFLIGHDSKTFKRIDSLQLTAKEKACDCGSARIQCWVVPSNGLALECQETERKV